MHHVNVIQNKHCVDFASLSHSQNLHIYADVGGVLVIGAPAAVPLAAGDALVRAGPVKAGVAGVAVAPTTELAVVVDGATTDDPGL
jgi:hypothetical protein